ncbi:MAG: ABC transporter permease [Chloroflexi bacterium]|nr:ABC transporter permease [Chloroflexota bacterium]
MSQYLLRRILLIIPLLFGVTVMNYTIYALAPGDPVSAMIDPMEQRQMTPETLKEMREALGLNKPLPVRYALWLKEVLRGNLGYSIWRIRPVSEVIRTGIGNTIGLVTMALLLSTIGGLLLGIISALKPYSALDYALTGFAFAGVAMPGFFFALVLIYLVSLRLGLLPTGGIMTPELPPSVSDRLVHLILPGIALAYESMGGLMRYTRSSMLEVLGLEYVTTARAKGLPEWLVVGRHVFRNALLPVITILGLRLPSLFGGAVLIETVFNFPGIGLTMVDATKQRDYPLLMGGVLITATLILFSNLLADMAYAWADPRIRYD